VARSGNAVSAIEARGSRSWPEAVTQYQPSKPAAVVRGPKRGAPLILLVVAESRSDIRDLRRQNAKAEHREA